MHLNLNLTCAALTRIEQAVSEMLATEDDCKVDPKLLRTRLSRSIVNSAPEHQLAAL